MPRPISVPKLTHHKASGKAVVRLSGTDVYCGVFGTPEAKARYDREVAEWLARGRLPDPTRQLLQAPSPTPALSVNEILLAYMRHAEQHYRRSDGTQTNEVNEYKQTFKVVQGLYGLTAAAEFGPLALKSVREEMVRRRWCRRLVNQRVNRVRRAFKRAAEEELIPFAIYQRLTTVPGLQAGRTDAKESDPVEPIAADVVEATLAHLNRQVRGLVEFQRLTGCRPGEACAVRRRDIEMGDAVWFYRPAQHKTAWRGKVRVIAIGPKAQQFLKEYFTPNLDDFLFSPRRAVSEFHATRAENRKTPRYNSHMHRNVTKRVPHPTRRAAEKYKVTAYEHAIARACVKAFPAPEPLCRRDGETRRQWHERLDEAQRKELAAWQSSHRWAPNQLRHSFATVVRKGHGLEAAQVVLGHSRADVTQMYAERNLALAAKVAGEIG
jgi:integrase